MSPGGYVVLASLLPMITGAVFLHKLKDPVVKTFFYYWIGICLIEGMAVYFRYKFQNNLLIYNHFILSSFLFIAYAAFQEKWRYARFVFWLTLPVLLGFHVIYYLEFNRYFYFISFLAQLVISAGLLLKMVDYEDALFKNPRFFIYASVMVYAASTASTLLIPDTAYSQGIHWVFFYSFKLSLTGISYLLFCIAFYVESRS